MTSLSAFSVKNPVAVNLLMILLIVGGLVYSTTLVREFFPPTDPEVIIVSVPYPGSTPLEVEDGVTRKIERAIEDIQGLKKFTSFATEGFSGTVIELVRGTNKTKVYNDIKAAVDAIDTFPDDAEEPTIVDFELNIPVITVVVYGDASERRLKEVAEDLDDAMRREIRASDTRFIGMRTPEVSVEIDPLKLEQFNLTFAEVASAIRRANVDVPGGEIKAPDGTILVRTLGEEDDVARIARIVVRADARGSAVRVRDVAVVRDTFEEIETLGLYKGKTAISLVIFKNLGQDAVTMSRQVREFIAKKREEFAGEAIHLEARADTSRFIRQRQELLLRNGLQGFVLVYLCLLLFLQPRVAFWVAMGLPISFLGTFILMGWLGASINLISLFGLIIVVGIVVDDGIVIGENIYRYYEAGMPPHRAAIEGAKEVTLPVIASVLTTILAFIPLMFIKGTTGDFFKVLPVVVICALTLSLVEALIILPSHLAGSLDALDRRRAENAAAPRPAGPMRRRLRAFVDAKERFLGERMVGAYSRVATHIIAWRYVFIAAMMAGLILSLGLVASGLIKFVFIQETDSETVTVDVEMSAGTQAEETLAVLRRIEHEAAAMPEVEGIFSVVGQRFDDRGGSGLSSDVTIGQVIVDLHPVEYREARELMNSAKFINALRARLPDAPGINLMKIESRQGGPQGKAVELEVHGQDLAQLQAVVEEVKGVLATYDGVVDIEDNLTLGKPEVRVALRPGAESLGLTTDDIALQLRGAFFGAEAQRFQRDRDEVRVKVRLDEQARRRLGSLETMRIKTPSGGRVPLGEVATLEMGRGYGRLNRINGVRAVVVSADVDQAAANTREVVTDLNRRLGELAAQQTGIAFAYGGEQLEVAESFGSLTWGFPVALFMIYLLLALQFNSYLQPLIIMSAIPFGIVGAILGHPVLGYPITILSMIGIVAVSGIVVNDAIVLVDFVNEYVRRGHTLKEAAVQAGRVRLRPVLLTSMTTVLGLTPLVFFERSFQAQFLIPMAVSICAGLIFATIITLLLVPSIYVVLEDVRGMLQWLRTGRADAKPLAHARKEALEAIEKSYAEKVTGLDTYGDEMARPGTEGSADGASEAADSTNGARAAETPAPQTAPQAAPTKKQDPWDTDVP